MKVVIPEPRETAIESALSSGVEWLSLGVEAISIVIIAVGVVRAVWLLSTSHSGEFTAVRLKLAKYLALALEFQLAADILSTAVAPSWDKIGKLGAIAVIRTALNYFLMREIGQEREKQRSEGSGGSVGG